MTDFARRIIQKMTNRRAINAIFYAHSILKPRLTYLSNLCLALVCSDLYDAYKPDARECILSKFKELDIEYIDIKGKGAYMAGGFVLAAVCGLSWDDSDIDIFSTFDHVIHKPYWKKYEPVVDKVWVNSPDYPPLHYRINKSRLMNHIEDVENHPYIKKYITSKNYTTADGSSNLDNDFFLMTQINSDLYHHRNLSFFGPIRNNKNVFKKAVELNEENEETETGGCSYWVLKHIRQIINFQFIPIRDERKKYENRDIIPNRSRLAYRYRWDTPYVPNEIKIQDILLEDGFDIESTVKAFDINLCQLYFDGEHIRFANLDKMLFKKQITYQFHDSTFCSGLKNKKFFLKTFRRIKKYVRRFPNEYNTTKFKFLFQKIKPGFSNWKKEELVYPMNIDQLDHDQRYMLHNVFHMTGIGYRIGLVDLKVIELTDHYNGCKICDDKDLNVYGFQVDSSMTDNIYLKRKKNLKKNDKNIPSVLRSFDPYDVVSKKRLKFKYAYTSEEDEEDVLEDVEENENSI